MDKRNSSKPTEKESLSRYLASLENLPFIPLLKQLIVRFHLTASQMVNAIGVDPAALQRIISGEASSLQLHHITALLNFLQAEGKLVNAQEFAVWHKQLHIETLVYQASLQLDQLRQRGVRPKLTETILETTRRGLSELYDQSLLEGSPFNPSAVTFLHEMLSRWNWIRIPEGFEVTMVERDRYYLRCITTPPRRLPDLGANYQLEELGNDTYTVRRRSSTSADPTSKLLNT